MTDKCALCAPPPLYLSGGRDKFLVTRFNDEKAFSLDASEMSLENLHDMVLATAAREKGALPLLKLVKFGDKRTDKRCLRHNANANSLSGIEGDYDGKQIPFDAALDMLRKTRLRALIYTSPSHTEAAPKWRVILPTSRDLPPADRYKLVARVNGVLGGVLAGESFVLSQAMYFGRVGSNPDHQAVVIDGDFIDLRNDLDAGAIGKPGGISHGGGNGFDPDEIVADEALIQNILDGSSFHPSLVSLSARFITRGADPEGAVEELRKLMDQSTVDQSAAAAAARWKARYDSIPELVASAVEFAAKKRTEAEGPPPAADPDVELTEFDREMLKYAEDVELAPSRPAPKTASPPPRPAEPPPRGAEPPPPKPARAPPKAAAPPDADPRNAHVPLYVQLAAKVWGIEQRRMTATGEWRFGSKTINRNGTWYDFENNTHGDLRDLMKIAAASGGADPAAAITAAAYDFPDEATIEPWDFLYGKHLLRGTVAGSAAMGGTGKSTMAIAEALAMASGRSLLGIHVARALRVLLINLEDNKKAMDKRIAAAMKQHGLKPKDIGDRLVVVAKGEMKLKIAQVGRGGGVERNEATIDALVNYAKKKQVDVISIDPFIKTHGVNENDNSMISDVIECFDDIAEAAGCALHLWHHTRKMRGDGATVESARGAMAFIDACRSVRILETLSQDEGKKLKIDRPGFYFRAFNGKRNFAPPPEESEWYRLESVDVGRFDDADAVGVTVKWEHPGTRAAEVTPETIAAVKRVVGEGNWREDPRANAWVGKPIAQVMGFDPDDDKPIIRS